MSSVPVPYTVTVSGVPSPSASAVVWLARSAPRAGTAPQSPAPGVGDDVAFDPVALELVGADEVGRPVDVAGPTVGLGSSLVQAPTARRTAAAAATIRLTRSGPVTAMYGWARPT